MKVSEKYGIIYLVLSSSVILILWSHYTIQFSARQRPSCFGFL